MPRLHSGYRLAGVTPCGAFARGDSAPCDSPVRRGGRSAVSAHLQMTMLLVAAAALAGLGRTQAQQQSDKPAADSPVGRNAAPPAPPDGLWPSEKLTELAVSRWAEELSRTYELDDVQRAKVREAAVQRWGTFLRENRPTLQPILNEFIEMRMELEPPSKERVQSWAERAAPAFEQFRAELNKGTSEFREILDPVQRAKFDLEVMQFGMGLQFAENKLRNWKQGQYEAGEFWEPVGDHRRARREERRERRARAKDDGAAPSAPDARETDQIALELASWDEYVATFIRLYKLDEGQQTAVLSIVSELKNRAIAHRDRHRDEIAELEKRIAGFSGSEQDLADLKTKLTQLYGPIDEMFSELKRRIEQIPTTEQRAAVK